MKQEERIMDALGAVSDRYIMEAAPQAKGQKKKSYRWIAAVLAVILGLSLCLQTAPVVSAVEYIAEQVVSLIETLFPPKEMTTAPEGSQESGTYVAGGQEPQQEEGETTQPGFAIYYDPETYTMVEEDGVSVIRPLWVPTREMIMEENAGLLEGMTEAEAEATVDQLLAERIAFYDSLPKCELEIVHLPDMDLETAAQTVRQQRLSAWGTVTEVEGYASLNGLQFRCQSGWEWDSPVEELYFTSDGENGSFQLTIRYFFEAAEGHGARLLTSLDSFQVIEPSDASAP